MSAARRELERFVRWTIEVERPDAGTFLEGEAYRTFTNYYQALPRPGDEAAIRRYLRGFGRAEAGFVAREIERFERPRLLDAGSGFGTYAMLYAAVGADVTGVDLRPDRLAVAERRLEFYRARTGRTLPVRYQRADLTADWGRTYDLVWLYNAISHIEPLDGFLSQARLHLSPHGRLVVGDINGGHPGHLRRLAEVRSEVVQEYTAPDGQRHAYAVERTFTPLQLREVMTRNGLEVVHHELYWGGLGVVPGPLYDGVLAPLQRQWRLGERTARRQLLVARAAGSRGR